MPTGQASSQPKKAKTTNKSNASGYDSKKRSDLAKIALKQKIPVHKVSGKTGKTVQKSKTELAGDLKKRYRTNAIRANYAKKAVADKQKQNELEKRKKIALERKQQSQSRQSLGRKTASQAKGKKDSQVKRVRIIGGMPNKTKIAENQQVKQNGGVRSKEGSTKPTPKPRRPIPSKAAYLILSKTKCLKINVGNKDTTPKQAKLIRKVGYTW